MYCMSALSPQQYPGPMPSHRSSAHRMTSPDPIIATGKLLVPDLIAYRAALTPQMPALRCGDDMLTYEELVARANQLARYLREKGVGAESFIAICLNRSVDMMVGILGSLIAGGTYIPIDPAYPRERIRSILEDSAAGFILTHSGLLSVLPGQTGGVICLDQEVHSINRFSGDPLDAVASPDNLAYIIYTSGSTGAPKGVMISHDSLRNFVRISQSALDVHPGDVYLQSASVAYALSVRQIMVPLVCGASLVIANEEQAHDPLLLFEEIKRSQVTLMDVVPSFWRAIIKRLQDLPEKAAHDLLDNKLQRIVSVGEALPYDIARDWEALGNAARLVNIFGQTETTGIVASHPIPPVSGAGPSPGIVPIGTAIAETRLYILNDRLEQVQPGEPGELCISNPCLARGYLNQPGLTAVKFIPNPFRDGTSNRLYRTGDHARQLVDGSIEFLGRADSQVKIRGQRLELGEVELVIRKHPDIGDCIVLASGDPSEEKSLTAYLVPGGKGTTPSEIRSYCKKFLPEYMVPARFIFLDAFPLNSNGKVDRRTLAALVPAEETGQTPASEIPGDAIEEKLAIIWRELLRLNNIGIHDDYFDLGGHSLMAVRLFSRVEREFGIRLPITTLFHTATISGLAGLLRTPENLNGGHSMLVPIRTGGGKPILFGVHGHEGGVLFWRDIVMHLPADQPFYAIQAQGVDGLQPAITRLEDMAARYIQEILKIQAHGPYYLCGFSMGGEIAFEMSQQLLRRGEVVGLLVMLDTKNPVRLVRSHAQAREAGNSKPDTPALNRIPDRGALLKRIHRHARRFFQKGVRNGFGYVWLLVQTRLVRFAVFSIAAGMHARGWRLPDSLLLLYLRTAHSKALYEYYPQPYPGRVILFRSSETEKKYSDDAPSSWKTLAPGGLEIIRFNATHNIVNKEYAEEVARKLQECLVRGRGN